MPVNKIILASQNHNDELALSLTLTGLGYMVYPAEQAGGSFNQEESTISIDDADLLILDIDSCNYDSLRTYENYHAENPEFPMLVLGTFIRRGSNELRDRLKNFALMEKPISKEDLASAVKECLGRCSSE